MRQNVSKCPKCGATDGLSAVVSLRSELKLPSGIDPEEVQVLAGRDWTREDEVVCGSCGFAGAWRTFAAPAPRGRAKAA